MNPPTFLREFTHKAELLGFTFDGLTGGSHPRYRHAESGRVVVAAFTPSDWRSERNSLADMERVSGRKLPRPNAAKYRHRRTSRTDLTLSGTERAAVEETDRLLAQADLLRAEWDRQVANQDRTTAAAARQTLTDFEEVRRKLAALHRIIPPITAIV